MGPLFAESPLPFGSLHLALAGLVIVFNIVVYCCVRGRREGSLLRLLWVLGLIMMTAEAFKQWYAYVWFYDRQISMYYFPWQLCSLAMYLSFAAIYLKGERQEAVLVYLCSFSLLGAVMALLFPGEMLRREVVFTLHSFIYHGLIISDAIIALEILKKRGRPSFRPAVRLFLITAAVAEVINILGRLLIHDRAREPNMFYISPFYPTDQPVLSDIARSAGILPEVIIYLGCIILASYLIFLAEDRLIFSETTKL